MNQENKRKIVTQDNLIFHIRSLIAEGGTANIYLADQEMGNGFVSVILKEYPSLESDPEIAFIRQNEQIQCERIIESGFPGALPIRYFRDVNGSDTRIGITSDVRKGMSLRQYVGSEEWKGASDYEKICLCAAIFQVVKNFHAVCGLFHGDLSPSNIYLYETGQENRLSATGKYAVALLDFGCAVPIIGSGSQSLAIGTPGFTHPDFENGLRSELYLSDELYSVLACCWYIVTGKAPKHFGMSSFAMKQFLPKLPTFCRMFDLELDDEESIEKTLNETINYLSHPQISIDRLYESIRREFNVHMESRFSDLNVIQRILPDRCFETGKGLNRYEDIANGKQVNFWQTYEKTDDSIFLIGDGGCGKTTSLIEILKKEYRTEKEDRQIIVFFELSLIPQNANRWYSEELGGTFLEQFLASYYIGDGSERFVSQDNHYVKEIHEMLFWDVGESKKQFTVLFDGLNELGILDAKSKALFYETMVRYLSEAKNVRCILTGRNDVTEITCDGLRKLRVAGLDDGKIEKILLDATAQGRLSKPEYENIVNRHSDTMSSEHRLWECLRIPFFLIMYCSMKEKSGIATRGEILKCFFHDKRETLEKKDNYGERSKIEKKFGEKFYDRDEKIRMDLSIYLILDFIVPEIAYIMFQNRWYFIDETALEGLIWAKLSCDTGNSDEKRIYQTLGQFYNYQVDVTEIMEALRRNASYENVKTQVCEILGIMRKTPEDTFFFTHQYFRDYFAARHVLNKLIEAVEFARCISAPWQNVYFIEKTAFITSQEYADYFSALVGEVMCESHNIPSYNREAGEWEVPVVKFHEQKIATKFLDLFRNVDTTQMGAFAQSYQIGLWNLFSIFRHGRIQNSGIPDLSLLSFKGLDLTGIPLNGILLSHFNEFGKEDIHAEFVKCKNLFKALLLNEKSEDEMCYAIHPTKQRIIVGSISRGFLREVDLETGEETRIPLPEEGLKKVYYINDQGDIAFIFFKGNMKETESETADVQPHGIKRLLDSLKLRDEDAEEETVETEAGPSINNPMMSKLEEWTVSVTEDVRQDIVNIQMPEKIVTGNVSVYFYAQSNGRLYDVDSLRLNECCMIESGFSNKYSTLFLFVQPPDRRKVICYEYRVDDKLKFPLKNENHHANSTFTTELYFLSQTEENGFYARMVDKHTYLIGSMSLSQIGTGIWNGFSESSQTAFLPFTPEEDVRIFSTASDGEGNILMVLGQVIQDSHLYQYTPMSFNLPEKELLSSIDSFEIHISRLKSVAPTAVAGRFLVANYGGLSLYDCKRNAILWKFPKPMYDYHYRSGILVVNALDGVYLVDEENGSHVCVAQRSVSFERNLFGKVNQASSSARDSMVLIYNGNQTVEWYSLKEARVRQISIIQKIEKKLEMILGDLDNMLIYGISDAEAFCWDGIQGNLKWRIPIPREMESRLLYIDIDSIHNLLEAVYEKKHYERFPLDYSYKVGTLSLERIEGEIPDCWEFEDSDKPVKRNFSGQAVLLEKATNNSETEGNTYLSLHHYFRNMNNESTPESDLGTVFNRYRLKEIWRTDKQKPVCMETIPVDEKVLGFWKEKVISITDDGSRLRFRINGSGRQKIMEFSWEEPLYGLFTVDEYVILEQEDRKSFFYWDSEKKGRNQVRQHEVLDGILCTDRKVQSRLQPSAPCGSMKQIEDDSNLPVKSLKNRIKTMNYPVIVLAGILVLMGYYLSSAARVSGIIPSNPEEYIKDLAVNLAMFIWTVGICEFLQLYFAVGKLENVRRFFPFCLFAFTATLSICSRRFIEIQEIRDSFAYNYFNILVFLALPFYVSALRYKKKNFIHYRQRSAFKPFHLVFMWAAGMIMMSGTKINMGSLFAYSLMVFAIFLSYAANSDRNSLKMILLALVTVVATTAYIMHTGIYQEMLQEIQIKDNNYMLVRQNLKDVIASSSFGGVSSVEITIKPYLQYCNDYFLNYIIGTYGKQWGVFIIVVFVMMAFFLLMGARTCSDKGDRMVCLGCSVYLIFQMALCVSNNFAILPYLSVPAPFLALGSPGSISSWMALATYLAFYRAHKEVYVR